MPSKGTGDLQQNVEGSQYLALQALDFFIYANETLVNSLLAFSCYACLFLVSVGVLPNLASFLMSPFLTRQT